MVLDRSYGGDRVLSNVSLDQIKNIKDEIDVYLEIDSVNQLLFEGFIEYYDLNRSQFKLYNAHQNILSQKKISDKPILLMTYDPFSNILLQKGYQEIASSKLSTINIIDLLVVKESVYQKYPDVFSQLRKSINLAIKHLEDDPYEYYKMVEHYLEGQTYDEFLSSLNGIKFIKTATDEKLYLDIYQRQIQKKN